MGRRITSPVSNHRGATRGPAPSADLLLNRRGASSVRAVPSEVKALLSAGKLETKNLCEMLALDSTELLKVFLEELTLNSAQRKTLIAQYLPYGHMKIMSQLLGAAAVLKSHQDQFPHLPILSTAASHRSDTVRSWAAFMTSKTCEERSLRQIFAALKPFAADSHMGVRECAWMSLRDHLHQNFEGALPHLMRWAKDRDFRVRRCAIEATRPRGVWCRHLEVVKENPEQAIDLINLVKSDEQRYVQNSVANWLNDAGKSKPSFVRQVCKRWGKESRSPATAYIIRRALRNL